MFTQKKNKLAEQRGKCEGRENRQGDKKQDDSFPFPANKTKIGNGKVHESE